MKRLWILLLLLPLRFLLLGQAVPPDLPPYSIEWYRDTAYCSFMFLSTQRFVIPATLPSTAMILDRRGNLVWYATSDDNIFAFGTQPNGKLAFSIKENWFELDSTLDTVPIPTCAGAAGNDFHDLIHLANGNILELCVDDTLMDLRGIFTNTGQEGDSAATVRYNIVNERNTFGSVIRQWRSIDHFLPTDLDTVYFDYPWFMELTHTNSMDFDGQNLLLSHRNLHEVTMIDWISGQVRWRLGGKNNDFTVFLLNCSKINYYYFSSRC